MRGRGGFIGANVTPAASAVNSAASGVWNLREAEALKRAGTWPRAFEGPTSVSGLQLWLDAADASTLFNATTGGSLVAADGTIKRWEDKSGNGNHATEATNAPIRKTGVFNGRDIVRFDGTDDILATGAISALNSLAMTHFCVCCQRATGTVGRLLAIEYGDFAANHNLESSFNLSIVNSNATAISFSRNSTGVAIVTPQINRFAISANTLFVIGNTISAAGGITELFNRNTSTNMAASSGGNVVDTPSLHERVSIGNSTVGTPVNADICEVIIYNTHLSTNDRNLVIDYLMAKWGIT